MKLSASDVVAMRSDQFLFQQPWNSDAEANVTMCLFELATMHDEPIKLVEKSRLALFPRFATNLSSCRLWIPRGFHDRAPIRKAHLIGHELTHFRKRKVYGDNRFNRLYIFRPAYRARFEVTSYREGLRLSKAHGLSLVRRKQEVDNVIRVLRKTYLINLSRDAAIERHIRDALEMEL